MRFAPEYVSNVLNDNFEDAKQLLLTPLMAIHNAHLVMLVEQAIVTPADARMLRDALDGIVLDSVRCATYDGSCEDLFFYIERLVRDACGDEVAGRLHTARSRNDIDMTMYRMRQREFVALLAARVLDLRAALIDLAGRHRDTVFAAHTHTQPAQPSTIAHYLLAVIEQLERDTSRLGSAYETTNCSPLGSCAITGTGFAIDRHRTSALLGFSGPTGNTYGSIATVDYLLESVSATAIMLVGLGRVLQDFLLWCTMEFGYLRLGEGFVQSSSIMPQKRNPVALEHARAIASKAVGQAQAILTTVHNTPFGDIVDTEDDLQPLVASMFRDATRTMTLVAATMRDADFDVARLAARAGEGGTTLTELADTLVRDEGLPFTKAHSLAAQLLRARTEAPAASLSRTLAATSEALLGRTIAYAEDRLQQIMSPRYFIEVRRTLGGPAPEETARAVEESSRQLARDRAAWQARRDHLARADRQLDARVRAL
ncbi:MAG: argininosuccinate lyase [Vicinamibacterales bacterium]